MVSFKYISFLTAVGGLNGFRVLLVYSGFTALMMLFSLLHIQATRFGFSMAISLKNGIWKLIFSKHIKEGQILEKTGFIFVFL